MALTKTELSRNYYKKYPWAKTLRNILSRLKNNLHYKNIHNFLTTNDLKILWFRDKAYLMKSPSIERINPSKDYMFDNCRYLELIDNLRGKKRLKTNSKFRRIYGKSLKEISQLLGFNYTQCFLFHKKGILQDMLK